MGKEDLSNLVARLLEISLVLPDENALADGGRGLFLGHALWNRWEAELPDACGDGPG